MLGIFKAVNPALKNLKELFILHAFQEWTQLHVEYLQKPLRSYVGCLCWSFDNNKNLWEIGIERFS